jgi:protein SCO1/2
MTGSRLAAVALLAVALTTAAGVVRAAPAASPQLDGLLPEPLPQKPTFTLTDTAGRPFPFAKATRGKLTYLYFGYTHCPDACPTTMTDISYALYEQPASVRRGVEVVFVTVDPKRDTRRALRAWLDHYSPSFVGLTGSPAQIEAAEREAGVPLAPPEKQKGSNYSVAHASIVLPYSPDGLAHVVYTQGFHANAYAHDMPLLLAKR